MLKMRKCVFRAGWGEAAHCGEVAMSHGSRRGGGKLAEVTKAEALREASYAGKSLPVFLG